MAGTSPSAIAMPTYLWYQGGAYLVPFQALVDLRCGYCLQAVLPVPHSRMDRGLDVGRHFHAFSFTAHRSPALLVRDICSHGQSQLFQLFRGQFQLKTAYSCSYTSTAARSLRFCRQPALLPQGMFVNLNQNAFLTNIRCMSSAARRFR